MLPDELKQIVEDYAGELTSAWARRKPNHDILVLGDLRRPDVEEYVMRVFGKAKCLATIVRAEQNDIPAMVAFTEPLEFLETLDETGEFLDHELTKELRGFAERAAAGNQGVPLLLIGRYLTCAAQWTPEDAPQ
jgi:hypothetical protein